MSHSNSNVIVRRSEPLFSAAAAMCTLALIASPIQAQPINEDRQLVASDAGSSSEFGASVAMSQGIIAVGARGDDELGADSGSAYLFDASTGMQTVKLLANDGAAGDQFGFSIATDGTLVAVGAPTDVHNGVASGSVYLFDASTGSLLDKLTADDASEGALFGRSVAMDGGVLAVGAMGDARGESTGAAYLFDTTTGNQLQKIVPDERTSAFGVSIAVDEGVVAVGSRSFFVLEDGFTLGAVYLFDVSDGQQTQTLRASNGVWTDFFAESIDIDNGLVAVGAWARSIFFDHSGAAYVFDADTGQQLHYIFPQDGHDRDNFGISVAIEGDVLAIGAHQDGDNGMNAGSAYLFNASTGSQIDKLLASDGAAFDEFGGSLAIENGTLAVGAARDHVGGNNDAGSVYVFGLGTAMCRGDCDGDSTVSFADLVAMLGAFGTSAGSACDADESGEVNFGDLVLALTLFGPCE